MLFDAHTHILPEEFRTQKQRFLERDATFRALCASPKARSATVEELVAEMDRSGVDASVAAGYGWTDIETARCANDYALKAASAHPRRIIPFCSVNPLWGRDAITEVERCAKAGARGIGELHPDTQNFLDSPFETLAPLFNIARLLGLPVLMHTSEPVGHAYPGKGTVTPEYSLALAQAFPSNTFIFAHFGGGLPFYALMPEVRAALQNVWFDSAAFPFLYRPEVFTAATAAAGANRILFASDFPLVTQRRALEEFRQAELSEEQRAAVLGGNAAGLLGMG
jgi:predicted TIM-barrel fold metal-dependent hydrolase